MRLIRVDDFIPSDPHRDRCRQNKQRSLAYCMTPYQFYFYLHTLQNLSRSLFIKNLESFLITSNSTNNNDKNLNQKKGGKGFIYGSTDIIAEIWCCAKKNLVSKKQRLFTFWNDCIRFYFFFKMTTIHITNGKGERIVGILQEKTTNEKRLVLIIHGEQGIREKIR